MTLITQFPTEANMSGKILLVPHGFKIAVGH